MKKKIPSRLFNSWALGAASVAPFLLAACGGGVGRSYSMNEAMAVAMQARQVRSAPEAPDMASMEAKSRLMQDLMSNPDLESWHDQRQKMVLALGDRVFEKTFDEVFDGMVVALATLGCRVNNIERTSGYITASLPDLGPERTSVLQQEALAEYAKMKGYPPSVLQRHGAFDMGAEVSSNMMARMGGSGLTMLIAKQSPTQTKVKLRFDNVYFPTTAQEFYRVVWVGVDKQMFLDKALDARRADND